MDAARLLTALVAQKGRVAVAQIGTPESLKRLIDVGFVRECGVVQSVLCDECDHPHDSKIVFADGRYGIFCPDLGFVAKSRSDLVAIEPDIGRLVAWLGDHLGCRRTKSTPIHGNTWRVGLISTQASDVIVYIHPAMRDASDLQSVKDAMARETKAQFGVVLTADGALSVSPFQTLRLDECMFFDEGTGQFVIDIDLTESAGAPQQRTGGRPSPYHANLVKIIANRKAAGETLSGVNAEQRAIKASYSILHPNAPVPSKTTILRAMGKA